jgi:hypothetical protein
MQAAVKAAALKALWRWWAANRMARWRLLATALSAIRTYVVWGRLAKRDARLHRRAHVLKHTLTTWRKNAQMEVGESLTPFIGVCLDWRAGVVRTGGDWAMMIESSWLHISGSLDLQC